MNRFKVRNRLTAAVPGTKGAVVSTSEKDGYKVRSGTGARGTGHGARGTGHVFVALTDVRVPFIVKCIVNCCLHMPVPVPVPLPVWQTME